MDLTDRYSLQPHLMAAMTSAPPPPLHQPPQLGNLQTSLSPLSLSPPQAPSSRPHHQNQQPHLPVVPDSYVGMRLAAISSSSESIDLASQEPSPSPSGPAASNPAFRCAPGEFHHPADDLPLTEIALDVVGPTSSSSVASAVQNFDDTPAATSGTFDSSVAIASGGIGLLNPDVVADIANDIRDIKRAIALQRKPLPSVLPQSQVQQQHQHLDARSSQVANGSHQESDDSSGVWVRMPSQTSLSQQQQQSQLPATSVSASSLAAATNYTPSNQRIFEHRHPFYDANTSNHHSDGNGVVAGGNPFTGPVDQDEFSRRLPPQQQQQQQQLPSNNGHRESLGHLQQQQLQHRVAPGTSGQGGVDERDYDSDVDTDGLMTKQYAATDRRVEIPELSAADKRCLDDSRKDRGREVAVRHPDQPTVLIEGLLFRALYLGSTQLVTEGQPSKSTRMAQAQEAVGRIKAPDGENQPCVPVDLFISTEKIMVLNTNLQEIMMDHALKTISYIADIGNILVLMARRRFLQQTERRQTKIVCHVFETDEAQLVAQSIGHAFQVAYMEFLRANGIDDPGYQLRDMDYQDVLNQQDIIGEELTLFSRRDMQKEVLVPKAKGEALGVVIVESGWGSMLPTVVLANMQPSGPAARCGHLNIGDQLLSINGVSLVGLPLANCQQHVKACKAGTAVKVVLVSCPPVVEVLIRRPDVKFQLGFSVQNGVICSLLRGGIAERGGVRVGHRIIEINGQSVVATPHDRIVAMLASGVGEIHMKTMPTSIFRLLTGQEVPHYI